MKIAVNSKIMGRPLTGVQRYLGEILRYIGDDIELISPARDLGAVGGHVWEQCVLPTRAVGKVLWSPSNSGPLFSGTQVLTVHDMAALDHPEAHNPKFVSWYKFLWPRLIPKVSRVIAISEFTKARILAHTSIEEDRIVVIPNGLDPRFSRRPINEVNVAVRKLQLPTEKYVLSLCSIEPRKNLKRMLEAWGDICRHVPDDIYLILAGGIGKASVFGERVLGEIPPRVHFTGHVPDELLPSLYSGALAFMYLSIYEGFGLPPLEAMACGVPVIVSNSTAIPEVVGSAAIMVDPLSISAICTAILDIVHSEALRDRLSHDGEKRARHFSWSRTAAETYNVLQAAISQ